MPTVVKTWAFASDAEGLADAGNSAVVFATQADGNPANCVKFTQATKAATHTEFARNPSTGETWETWGVPAGSIITSVQITAWSERLVANTKLSSHSIKARVIGSGGATVHSVGDLLDVALGTTTDATWQAGSAGTSRAVDSASQALTTDVRLELEYTVVTSGGGGSASVDQRFDQIELTITYEAGPAEIIGTSTQTIADVTGTAAGTVGVNGASTQTIEAVTGTAAGTVTASGVNGDSTATIADVTATSSGTVSVNGASTQTIATVTGTADGVVTVAGVTGDSTQTLTDVTGPAAGTVGVTGASTQTIAAVTGPGEGSVTTPVIKDFIESVVRGLIRGLRRGVDAPPDN